MKNIKQLLAVSATVLAALIAAPGVAMAQTDMPKMEMGKADSGKTFPMTDGEVKKVNKDASKITIKHGEIKNLDMPGMTMIFTVKEAAFLDKVKAGDKIKFVVANEGGKMMVTALELAK
ncbi:Cation efflux system protein CusF [Polaromonas vacuolata]|uniref:Cation efflux system protein CusF n=1 Tax=Polaromonas vacuolata TaxID=37448 RepID=A0A6H2HBM0_9BURK|nr:copper-binding protein [Polaromonas vacuolata]QJC57269.1 Cation efflux system protein CusF [Polaromonas vacuolata]